MTPCALNLYKTILWSYKSSVLFCNFQNILKHVLGLELLKSDQIRNFPNCPQASQQPINQQESPHAWSQEECRVGRSEGPEWKGLWAWGVLPSYLTNPVPGTVGGGGRRSTRCPVWDGGRAGAGLWWVPCPVKGIPLPPPPPLTDILPSYAGGNKTNTTLGG